MPIDAGPYRRAGRFADRGLWACRRRTVSCRACKRRWPRRASPPRSPMPASPAIPPRTGWPGSTGRCRTAPMRSSSSLAPTTCCAASSRETTRAALDAILHRLTARHIAVLLCGMRAAPNLGADYGAGIRAHLSGACRQIRRAALSVLSRRRRRRSQADAAGRPASQRRRRRRDRRAHLAEGGGARRRVPEHSSPS